MWSVITILVLASTVLSACNVSRKPTPTPAATQAVQATEAPGVTEAAPTPGSGEGAASPTAGPTTKPTAEPTQQPLQTGEIWFDKEHRIPALLGSASWFDPDHPMQVDAARAMARYWLESPYTQRMLDKLMEDHPETGVYCAYTKAFDNPGQEVEFNAKEDAPGGIIYPHSRELAVATYINGPFSLNLEPRPSESEVNPETGWLLDKERVPDYGDANIVAVSPTFYLGYLEGYGKLYVNWQQLCSGLPYLVWDPYQGFLTREMLKNPDIVDELQPGTVVALTEALFYEMERAEPGYGQVRETYFYPSLPPTLINVNTAVNYEKATRILTKNDLPPLPSSWDRNKMAAAVRYLSIVTADGRWREDEDIGWFTPYAEDNDESGIPPWGYGEQAYSSQSVSTQLLWPKDNLPPYAPTALTETATDGLYDQLDIPLAVTSYAFWWRLLVEQGYQRPDDATFKTGEGTVLDLMFGLNLPNFRPDQAQAQPLAFNLGEGSLYGGYTDGVYPNQYGTMLSNPLRMAGVEKEIEAKVFGRDPDEVTNQFLADYALAVGPMIPALQFHLNPKGAVIYADWKPITSPPELQGYVIFDGEEDEPRWTETFPKPNGGEKEVPVRVMDTLFVINHGRGWYANYSFGNTFYLGGGRVHAPGRKRDYYHTMYSPAGAAGGRFHYGGPVFFQLTDLYVVGHRTPFPLKKYGDTFVNPETGRYTLDEEAIAAMSKDPDDPKPNVNIDSTLTDFGIYVTCAPYAQPNRDVPNKWFRAASSLCAYNIGYEEGRTRFEFVEVDISRDATIEKVREANALEEVPIVQGYGQAVFQSAVLLMGDLVENPEALEDLRLMDWLREDQEALKEAADAGKAIYDPHAPYFGLYVLPTYHVPVFYYALNPVCQFDAACLVMSNDMLTRPGVAYYKQAYPNALAMPVISDPLYSDMAHFDTDIAAQKFKHNWSSNPALWDHYAYFGAGKYIAKESPRHGLRDAMSSPDRRELLVEQSYWYVPDIERMMQELGLDKETFPLYFDDSDTWDVLIERADGHMFAYLAPFWLLEDYGTDRLFDSKTNYWRLSMTYLPTDYERAFDGRHYPKYVPWHFNRVRRIPPAVELRAVADEAGVCLPYPHPEQGECAVQYVITTTGEYIWHVPIVKRDVDAVRQDLEDWTAKYPDEEVTEVHEPRPLNNLCETSMFYHAQQMFDDATAQRLWKVAYMLTYGDPSVLDEVPPFRCENNDDYLATYRAIPWYTPTLYQMLHDGKFGGLSHPPEAWQQDPEMVWLEFWKQVDALNTSRWYLRFDPFKLPK